jgi:hypothetical protein
MSRETPVDILDPGLSMILVKLLHSGLSALAERGNGVNLAGTESRFIYPFDGLFQLQKVVIVNRENTGVNLGMDG